MTSKDVEADPAKMFLGLLVLIVVVTCGFLVVRLVGGPVTNEGPGTDQPPNSQSLEDEFGIPVDDELLGGSWLDQRNEPSGSDPPPGNGNDTPPESTDDLLPGQVPGDGFPGENLFDEINRPTKNDR